MKAAEYRERTILTWPEKDFQAQVIKLAKAQGWWVHHHYDSRRSEPGWPDLVLLRGDRALFRELKREKGRTTPAQEAVIGRLIRAGLDADVWRPRDFLEGRIQQELS